MLCPIIELARIEANLIIGARKEIITFILAKRDTKVLLGGKSFSRLIPPPFPKSFEYKKRAETLVSARIVATNEYYSRFILRQGPLIAGALNQITYPLFSLRTFIFVPFTKKPASWSASRKLFI